MSVMVRLQRLNFNQVYTEQLCRINGNNSTVLAVLWQKQGYRALPTNKKSGMWNKIKGNFIPGDRAVILDDSEPRNIQFWEAF